MKTEITKVEKTEILTTTEFTSLEMSKLVDKTEHKQVIREIKKEIGDVFGEDALAQVLDYQDGGKYPPSISELFKFKFDSRGYVTMVNMTKNGWLQMGARYDAKTRYAIISYANSLEKENKALKKSINDVLVERLDNGDRKIIKNFIKDTINASGYSGLKVAVIELNKAVTGKEYKEWLLKQLMETFITFTDEMTGKQLKVIKSDADAVELSLVRMLKNFYGYSRGQVTRALKKENESLETYNGKLRTAKNALGAAYLANKPMKFTGSLEVDVDEEIGERMYYTDNEDINFSISPSSFETAGKTVYYMSGIVNIKEESLFLDVTGGINSTIFQTKVRDTKKAEYSAIIEVFLDTHEYNLIVTKLK